VSRLPRASSLFFARHSGISSATSSSPGRAKSFKSFLFCRSINCRRMVWTERRAWFSILLVTARRAFLSRRPGERADLVEHHSRPDLRVKGRELGQRIKRPAKAASGSELRFRPTGSR